MAKTIWELDFYSRPILDENQKKVWEVLICESPLDTRRTMDSLFRYAKYCSNSSVNSIFLRETLEEAIAKAPQPPQRIRFFRRAMNNMIVKACEDLGLPAIASSRTYALQQWIEQRSAKVYPQEPGYDEAAANSASVQYAVQTPVQLPDAIRGDKGDRWAIVSLSAADFAEMSEWDIAFGEGFPLEIAGISQQTQVPGLIIFSPRALPFAGWLSGVEVVSVKLIVGQAPSLILTTGISDAWILAALKTPETLAEAEEFKKAKVAAQGVHFLAIQGNPEAESFAGFWLLKD